MSPHDEVLRIAQFSQRIGRKPEKFSDGHPKYHAAEGAMLSTQHYTGEKPINLGAGFKIAIKDWVDLIVGMAGLGGKIVLDKTKPFGQPRRMLDTTKAERYFGFKAKTPFEGGLRKTVDWSRRPPRKSS
jgi:nucleoside-diphosphate-sugar epimerase